MTEKELYTKLETIGIPVTYYEFSKNTEPPFIAYYRVNNERVLADDSIYISGNNINIELYTPKKRNTKIESKLETLLDENGLIYDVTEVHLKDEQMVELIYSVTI